MPELPDITIYVEALGARIVSECLTEVRRNSPFLLRTVEPPLDAAYGHPVVGLRRWASASPSASTTKSGSSCI